MQPVLLNTNTQKQPWKDAAMEKAEYITDIWEVVKAYMGRAAEWVLFVCMIINIIEMLPGIAIAGWILNLVLGVQAVMLDIGGMSLASMAEHARERGNKEAAKKAAVTSRFLIGLMITTLLLVAIGVLFPAMKSYTDMAEKGLILARVVMTVIYGHVIHSLRGSRQPAPVPAPPAVPQDADLETLVTDILLPVLLQYRTEVKLDIAEQVKQALSAISVQAVEHALMPLSGALGQSTPQASPDVSAPNVEPLPQPAVPSPARPQGWDGDDSPRLQAGGFWNDAGVSSHTSSSVHAHKRDKAHSNLCIAWHVPTFGTLVLLPKGAYLGTCKHD